MFYMLLVTAMPLLKSLCYPWAKKYFFISTESIRNHLTEIPLSPLVALGAYFTSQKTSLLDHSHRHDPTIKKLYDLSQRIFKKVAVDENTTTDNLLTFCRKSESKIQEGIAILEEPIGTSSKKRLADCLNDAMEIIKYYKIKYAPDESSPASSTASSPEPAPSSVNWKFVDNYIQSLGDEKMNWNACFVECHRRGVLLNYNKSTSLKSGYRRWKRQQR